MGNTQAKQADDSRVVQDIILKHGWNKEYYFELVISSPESWMELACQGSDRVFARTTMVKAVIQHFLPSSGSFTHDPVIYFLNSKAYRTHLPFCGNICHLLSPHLPETLKCADSGLFNFQNYKQFPRQFVLLSIIFYADLKVFGVELWPGDNLPPEAIQQTHDILRKTTYFGDQLKWRVASPLHDSLFRQVLSPPKFYHTHVLHDSDLFNGVVYQPLHCGLSFGICKIWRNGTSLPSATLDPATQSPCKIDSEAALDSTVANNNGTDIQLDAHGAPVVDRRTILIAEELPLDLTPIRALVTQQLQTPLSHVALLCSNRGTPNMALRTALQDFASYDGCLVKLVVNHGDYSISLATEEDESKWLAFIEAKRATRVVPTLHLDTTVQHLIPLPDVKIVDDLISTDPSLPDAVRISHAIGSKALNLARFLHWDLPDTNNLGNRASFIIPFHYFSEFVSMVAPEEYALIASSNLPQPDAVHACSQLREKILSASIPAEWTILDEIEARITAWNDSLSSQAPPGSCFRSDGAIFRSSTNCEDLAGFPSAGLYSSEPVKSMDRKSFEKAILTVWASMYLEKAYLERREFGIAEKDVCMAILVMPLLASCVKANGVAVTTNPFRIDLGGHYLNIQAGTVAVTDACGGNTPEQVMFIRDGFKELTMEYLSPSNLVPKGEHLMTPSIAEKLNRILHGIHNGFRSFHEYPSTTNAADVEFFLLESDEIVIVQARPVKVQRRSK